MKQASHRLVIGSIFFCMDQFKDPALPEERKFSGVHILSMCGSFHLSK